MIKRCDHFRGLRVISYAVMLSGCAAAHKAAPSGSVASAWQQRDRASAIPVTNAAGQRSHLPSAAELSGDAADSHAPASPPSGSERAREGIHASSPQAVIATVNGRPIARDRLVNFLLQSHGAEALEQLLGLEAAAMAATKRGLTITRADIDHEQNLTLRRLANPLPSLTPEPFDRPGAEDLLDAVLSARRVSRPEFDLLTRRNAYLRKIVESEQEFTDEQLRMEFQRLYGNRVQVRHIQLATLAEAGRIRERLAAGVDFGELAQRYSAHAVSAADKGLLAPFSAQDDRLPAKFRKVAFSLKPGEVSKAVRIGEWYHLIKLEKVLPPEDRTFEQVRSELEHALRERVTEPEMLELFDRLLDEASIEVYDPALAGAFEKKHARRGR